jgi:hypothetical protein
MCYVYQSRAVVPLKIDFYHRNLIKFFQTIFITSLRQQSSGVQLGRPGDGAEIEFKKDPKKPTEH